MSEIVFGFYAEVLRRCAGWGFSGKFSIRNYYYEGDAAN